MKAALIADLVGPDGLIVLVVAVLLLFGGSRVPKLARGLGAASHEFKKGIADGTMDPAPNAADAAKETPDRTR